MEGFMKKTFTFILSAALILSACSGNDSDESAAKYTYRTTSAVPSTWSPTDYRTGSDGTIIDYTSSALYNFIMNDTKDGYKVACELASALPEDVSVQYAGNPLYGVPKSGITGYAWKFELNQNAVWEDGTKIDADTWEYSFKQFLNPQMKNYRASELYQSTLSLANAEDYYNGKTTWDKVGFVKNDEYSFTLILTKSISNFSVLYATTSAYLLHPGLYEAGKKQTGDIIKSAYGTSKELYSASGPYKIARFQPGKEILLEKNENWYGWTDGNHVDQYMTTGILIDFTTQHTTQISLFMQGRLDAVSLDSEDLKLYGNSPYRITSPQSFTWEYTFNSDKESLKKQNSTGVNHVLPAYEDFRHAVSLSLNRQLYVDTITPVSVPGFGLLNTSYISNPETGEIYRDTPQAQKILCEIYGTNSVESITGYNREEAASYFQKAYDKALAAGDIKENDRFQIAFHSYSSNTIEVRTVNFLQEAITEATVGTSLEGKITVTQFIDEDYYTNLRNGKVDCCMTSWGGSSFDPYGVTWCYCTKEALHEYGFKPEEETVTISFDGLTITDTYYNWYINLCEKDYSNAPYETRLTILSQLEKALLKSYRSIPVRYYYSVSLDSHRIIRGSDHYIDPLVEYGGLRFMKYSMNDEEWDLYCQDNNNQLKY